jgi:hypothetical protein
MTLRAALAAGSDPVAGSRILAERLKQNTAPVVVTKAAA